MAGSSAGSYGEKSAIGIPLRELKSIVLNNLVEFAVEEPAHDDRTMIAVKIC